MFQRLWTLFAVTFLSILADSLACAGKAAQGREYLVQLADGNVINMAVLTDAIEIDTEFGKLKVPVSQVRGIVVGLRYPAEMEKRIAGAVDRLGSDDAGVRAAARRELAGFKEMAYPALHRASASPDVERLAAELIRELEEKPGEPLRRRDRDVLFTTSFSIIGRIETPILKVRSRIFGEGELRITDALEIRLATFDLKDDEVVVHRSRGVGPAEANVYVARLVDGSLVDVQILVDELDIALAEGRRKLPLSQVRRIDVGFRYPEGIEDRVAAAVARLGDGNFKSRDAAATELFRLKELAYPALVRAAKSADLETKRRAAELVGKLNDIVSPELLRAEEQDVIITPAGHLSGRIEGGVWKIRSAILGEGRLALVDTLAIRSVNTEQLPTRRLLERVRTHVQAGRIFRSGLMGSGREPYEEIPKGGGLLTGFEVTYGNFGGNPTVTTVRPIFSTMAGRLLGATHGNPGEGVIRVEAKPGYAVGAVTIKAGAGVDGMSLTFMQIRDNKLNPKQAYESQWLGGLGGEAKMTLTANGEPIVGIVGRTAEGASTFNGLGLVTIGQPIDDKGLRGFEGKTSN